MRQNSLNQIFNPNALFFSLLRGTTLYYNAIYIPFTLFASFMGYEDDILEFISNLYAQGTKVGGKRTIFCGKSFEKVNSAVFMEFVFSKFDIPHYAHLYTTLCTLIFHTMHTNIPHYAHLYSTLCTLIFHTMHTHTADKAWTNAASLPGCSPQPAPSLTSRKNLMTSPAQPQPQTRLQHRPSPSSSTATALAS